MGDVRPFLFPHNSFSEPPDGLPPLELENKLVSEDWGDRVEIDVAIDGVACEVEGLID